MALKTFYKNMGNNDKIFINFSVTKTFSKICSNEKINYSGLSNDKHTGKKG